MLILTESWVLGLEHQHGCQLDIFGSQLWVVTSRWNGGKKIHLNLCTKWILLTLTLMAMMGQMSRNSIHMKCPCHLNVDDDDCLGSPVYVICPNVDTRGWSCYKATGPMSNVGQISIIFEGWYLRWKWKIRLWLLIFSVFKLETKSYFSICYIDNSITTCVKLHSSQHLTAQKWWNSRTMSSHSAQGWRNNSVFEYYSNTWCRKLVFLYSYSGDFLKPNIIRIRIRAIFSNWILFVFVLG